MVLVDTSVWIRFLSGRKPFDEGMDQLLARDEVVAHELIYGELLMGDVGGGRARLLADYARLHQAKLVPHADVAEFARKRRLHGRGLGWIDAHLLASTVVERLQVWTADPRFAGIADELGVSYTPAPG